MRYLTSGESHGQMLCGILEGMPANLKIDINLINKELFRRQQGFGRGNRMKIESDTVQITSGVRFNKTTGAPICLIVKNKDWENWLSIMSVDQEGANIAKITNPRPGHADLSGLLKYGQDDIRNILERASARETAIRVALGAIAKQFLSVFNISILSHTIAIGNVKLNSKNIDIEKIKNLPDSNPVRCIDEEITKKMQDLIIKTKNDGDSLGGGFEIIVLNVPVGLGSYVHWDKRLDGILSNALMSIPAIKAVEIGLGKDASFKLGSKVHDEIFYSSQNKKFYRKTNRAGGIEGGISNGESIILKAWMKPIPTLSKPLSSVDVITKNQTFACKERSDVCAVPSAGIVGEAVIALEITKVFLEKFGQDSIQEIKKNYQNYLEKIFNNK